MGFWKMLNRLMDIKEDQLILERIRAKRLSSIDWELKEILGLIELSLNIENNNGRK